MVRSASTRIWQAATVGATVTALSLSIAFGGGSAVAQDSSSTASPSAASCNVEQAVTDAPAVYTVDGEASTASYRVMEELSSVGTNEVVGTTNAILGSILFDENNVPVACSNFAVDMRTMETDESKRDNYLRENTLESDTFPYATFVVSSVTGLEDGLSEGETATVGLTGDFTLHGVTKTVTWDGEVTLEGETITGTASHTFLIADYDMEKPIIGPVVSIADEVTLEVGLSANLDAAA